MKPTKDAMRTKVDHIWRVNGWQLSSGGVFAAYSAEAYLIEGPEPVLIDCGSHLTFEELKSNLAALGYRLADIACVIGTHSHWDHIGSMAAIKKEGPTKFAIHEDDAEEARAGFHDKLSPHVYGPGVEPDIVLQDDEVFHVGQRKFEVTHVPGHSPGSICIRTKADDSRQILFSGDTIHGIYAPRPGVDVVQDLKKWAAGIQKVLGLEIDLLFEGHVMPQFSDITKLDKHQRATYVDQVLTEMEARRQGHPNPKPLIEKRLFLLQNGFLALPDYYISKACQMAGVETDRPAQLT